MTTVRGCGQELCRQNVHYPFQTAGHLSQNDWNKVVEENVLEMGKIWKQENEYLIVWNLPQTVLLFGSKDRGRPSICKPLKNQSCTPDTYHWLREREVTDLENHSK